MSAADKILNRARMADAAGDDAGALQELTRLFNTGQASTETLTRLAIAMRNEGNTASARTILDFVLEIWPGYLPARYQSALLSLTMGDFGNGWDGYEYRKLSPEHTGHTYHFPQWKGLALSEHEALVITNEQGLGDEIMFMSCLDDVLNIVKPGQVIIECAPSLVDLFRRSFPCSVIEIAPQRYSEPVAIDLYKCFKSSETIMHEITAGDLPALFRRHAADFDRPMKAYLKANGILAAQMRNAIMWDHYIKCDPNRPIIGVSWRGGTGATRRAARSLSLEQLLPVFKSLNATFVSLQYDADRQEAESFAQQHKVTLIQPTHGDHFADLDKMASLLGACDAVITVCGTTAHLAGAMALDALVLAPKIPEWRYGIGGGVRWYPSLTIRRQEINGDWSDVIIKAMNWLQNLFPKWRASGEI